MGKFLSTKLARDDSTDRERIACETVFFDRAIFRETRTRIRGLFIPFGAVWLSQFALPVSRSPARVYRTRCHEYSFSLSFSPRRIPFPSHSDCRISLERFESPRSNDRRFDDSKHELFLLEHLAVIKRFRRRRKGEKRNRETLPSLEDDKKRIRKQRFQAYDRITRRLLLFTREEDWFYFSIGHEYRYAKCGNFLPVHPVNDHPRNLNNV